MYKTVSTQKKQISSLEEKIDTIPKINWSRKAKSLWKRKTKF